MKAKAQDQMKDLTQIARDKLTGTDILNSLPHPVLLVRDGQKIIVANSAAEIFLQSSLNVLSRQKLTDFIPFDSPLIELIEQVHRTGATVNKYGVDFGTVRIGDHHLVDIYGGPLQEDTSLCLVLIQQRNVAQMIERQLTHRAAARSVSGLAAVLAHEIKNPLSGIRGAVQLLETSVTPEERSLTHLIYAEIDRICKLVDRMEIFGDERPPQHEPVNIHDVLGHVKKLSVTGFARNIKIIEDYDPSLPDVSGNRDQLIQVFLNLVKNAAEAIAMHSPVQGGHITLKTAFKPGMKMALSGSGSQVSLPLEISVEDNGGGIPESLKPNLFDPFVTTKQNGTGLGLALVAKIIGDHGGIIECDTSPGSTVFRTLLPVHKAKAQAKKNNG